MKTIKNPVHNHLRPKKKFPHIWCPGCSHGITSGAVIRAIDKSGYNPESVVLVSGIGCASRMPVYFNFNSLHTTHGRPIAFATGVKASRPELKVVVITSDGDGTAIGGNHFIHAARRNIDLTVILYNNHVYGMTGGQFSPTTPSHAYAATAPWGNYDPMFDICKLAIGSGATFVARGSATNAVLLQSYIEKALKHKGFSLVEVMSFCPSVYSFYNKAGNGPKMLMDLRDNLITVAKAKELREKGETVDKVEIGILHEVEAPEFVDTYRKFAGKEQKPFSLHLTTLDL